MCDAVLSEIPSLRKGMTELIDTITKCSKEPIRGRVRLPISNNLITY